MLTILLEQVLEIVQVQVLVSLGLFGERDEEANEEDDDHEQNECNGPLEGAPEALSESLLANLGGILVVLLVVEVGKWNDNETQKSVQRV